MNWLNRQARRVPTWVVYVLGLVPLGFLVWGAIFGGIGPDPVKAIERGLGLRGLQFLLASLAITPLRRAGLNLSARNCAPFIAPSTEACSGRPPRAARTL